MSVRIHVGSDQAVARAPRESTAHVRDLVGKAQQGDREALEELYLLHFDRKIHGAQHYLGYSVHITRRLRQHLHGAGARLVRQALRAGITVGGSAEEGVTIQLSVVVEYGLNLAEVASTLRNRVRYEVERLTGLPVAEVDVRIEDVKRSSA